MLFSDIICLSSDKGVIRMLVASAILNLILIIILLYSNRETCEHDYEQVDNYETESKFEKTKKAGLRPTYIPSEDLDSFYAKKHVTVLTCSKCQKIKKIVECI